MRKQSGEVTTLLLLAIVALGAGLVASKTLPIFNGDSRRAKEGQETTSALVTANETLAAAQTASAVVIGESAAALPESKERSFILNEVPIMLARGPSPDPKQLLAARDRRIAFLEGNLEAQREQTERALKDATKLRDKLTEVEAAKRKADDEISIAAAEKIAANRTAIGFGALAAIAGIAYLWARRHVNTLGAIVPALETAYANADKKAKDILDKTVFSTLGDKLDREHKKLIRKIKDRT